ncbi:MAG: hypothetical protein KDD69_09955 [Bdellovibrionales bacterium]|nr:hypothetical protein [Bdellovibrionales bacterium]
MVEGTPEYFSVLWWQVLLGGVSTLAIFSFLYRENPIYRIFEHVFIGIATGYTTIATVRFFLWPEVFKPLLGLDRVRYPDGTFDAPYNELNLLYLLPMSFGLLFYCILTKRHKWLAQLVIGCQLGAAGGLAFKGTFTELLPQVFDSFRSFYVPGSVTDSLTNIFFVVTLLCSLAYFFFTFKRSPGGAVELSSTTGRWLMMGCFGAFFGSTIMARMALLVERLEFLINDWTPIFFQ